MTSGSRTLFAGGATECQATARRSVNRTFRTCWRTCTRCRSRLVRLAGAGFLRVSWDNFAVKSVAKAELFRRLPSVDELLRTPAVGELTAVSGSAAVTDAARGVLGRM